MRTNMGTLAVPDPNNYSESDQGKNKTVLLGSGSTLAIIERRPEKQLSRVVRANF